MSDGPYRSLPMRPGWKKVAKQAENKNFDTSQIAESIAQALIQDFARDIPNEAIAFLKNLFQRKEADLFPQDVISDLPQVRKYLEGSSIGSLLFDFIETELGSTLPTSDGLAAAVGSMFEQYLPRAERQIEEFYLRHSRDSNEMAPSVRHRLRDAATLIPIEAITQQVLGIGSPCRANVAKFDGLDDGVPLR